MSKVLLVEDEPDLAKQIKDWLAREHHLVELVDNGQVAADVLRVTQFDLIILDWQLPGLAGIDICKQYRNRGGRTPVLMLTARTAVDDREQGLDAGADDYLCKPFALKELSARIRALLRRASGSGGNTLHCRNIVLDPGARKVTRNGAEVHLEPKEFALLEFLMRNPNVVFSSDALLTRVWESDTAASPDAIRTYVRGLRRKLDDGDTGSIITTVHGLGYRLDS